MVIATRSAELALRVGASIDGRKHYVSSVERAIEIVAEWRPALLLLDAKMGLSRVRSVELIPRVLQLSQLTRVVLLSYSPSREEVVEARDMGAFGTVDMNDEWWDRRLERIIASAARHRRAQLHDSKRLVVRH